MFFSVREKIIFGSIIALIIIIPASSFVIATRLRTQTTSEASTNRSIIQKPVTKEATTSSSLEQLKNNLSDATKNNNSDTSSTAPTGSTDTTNPIAEVSFGPTLNFQLNIEGRPSTDQSASQLFIGIAEGAAASSPQYLLSFKVDVGASGKYTGLSLAGLTQNTQYTAYVKGRSQIATAASFTVSPTVTDLGTVTLQTGDLNEDNVVNAADLTVAITAYNSTASSTNWNAAADFNLDGRVNNFDLAFIYKNNGLTGAGSAYVPTTGSSQLTPKSQGVATPSGSFIPPTPYSSSGYWMWIPSF